MATNFNNKDLTNYYAKIYAELENETLNDPYGNYILKRVKGGKKEVVNKTQSEIRNFDMSFLDHIESVYPALMKIMKDPKKSIRYEEDTVKVEKAKKINSDTVRHLASHTQFIKEVTKEGDVIPSKVLTTFAEEELAIYENRFIKSLVKRIDKFLERRYQVMKVSLESFESEKLNVENKFLLSGQEVTVSLDITIKNDLTQNVETTKQQYERLLYDRKLIQGLYGTDFMKALAKAKDVMPPIMKTNIILHNPDFKLAYGLWLYLDRVDSISTNIDVSEKSYKYSKIFDKDINSVMALALTSFIKNRAIDGIYASKKLDTVEAPKPEMKDDYELEVNLEADNNKLEDYTMNELLLSQTEKYFESSLEGLKNAGQKYHESIRTVYRQMLDMLDQIYPTAFGVADDELESKNLYEQLEFQRRKLLVYKTVRGQKQMNIARMAKEEKSIEKTITKIQEKIKVQEQKEREKLERERQREEAKRLASIEAERRKEEKKRKLEQQALELQKAIEKKKIDLLNKDKVKTEEKAKLYKSISPLILAKRKHMKEVKQEFDENLKNEEMNQISSTLSSEFAPVRRKDEYDDMTDEELEALMNANDLLDDSPKKKVVKKVVKKKEAPKPEDSKPKENVETKDIEDMSSDELASLMATNGFNDVEPKKGKKPVKKVDANLDLQNLDNEPKDEETKPTIKRVKKTSKKEKEEDTSKEETPIKEEEPLDTTSSNEETPGEMPNISENSEDSFESEQIDEPKEKDENSPLNEEVPSNLDTEEFSNVEDGPTDSSLDDLSDEELERLMKENGLDQE